MLDAVIVGARCAGSPLARFLALAGKRVALVDAATFPSDQPLSTHFIQPYGVKILDELGLGDRIRKITTPVHTLIQAIEDNAASFYTPVGGLCPRRNELDHVLVEGAREAGAELRLGERVVDVLRDGERVVGVVTEDREGRRTEIRARVVVGADGRNSSIAELVGAAKYLEYTAPRAAYWAYWPRPPNLEAASLIRFAGKSVQLMFPTGLDQILCGVAFPVEELDKWKADPQAALVERLRTDPMIGPLVEGPTLGKTIGMVKLDCFFRQAAGPGWALVGDSGLHKDPTPGLGISDALRDARALAHAIIEGTDAALVRYWRQRDVDSIQLYCFAQDMGDPAYNNAFNEYLFSKLDALEAWKPQFIRVIDREVSPYEALRVGQVMALTFGALVRGKFGVLGPFMHAGKRQGEVKKLVKERQALLLASA